MLGSNAFIIINMKSITIKIIDPSYLHNQMAAKLQRIAGKYTCDVDVIVGTTKANAKSLINLTSPFIPCVPTILKSTMIMHSVP